MASEALEDQEPIRIRGRVTERPRIQKPLPAKGEVKRYIFTSAQNNTRIHEDAWLNILAMVSHYDAELMVGTFSYDKGAYGKKAVKRGTFIPEAHDDLWYDPHLLEYIMDESVQLAPGLVWCGEMNILPTSPNPLSELEPYNGRNSNIVPHAKFALTSVAGIGDEATKFNYTTGTTTQRNYIQKKAGLKAERFHGYGALLVEVLDTGAWFVRQLQATEEGVIRDLGLKAQFGVVTEGNPISAITLGDVHVRVIDQLVKEVIWGEGGIIDTLAPDMQILHDLIDFRSRNHHEMKDPLANYKKFKANEDGVADEVAEVGDFLAFASRSWLDTHIVQSNHHEAMLRWLKESKWQDDPKNAYFYHEAWLALLDGVEDIFQWSLARICDTDDLGVHFLVEDENLVVAGVELAQHGHLGINGSRGNHRASVKLGRSTTQGHEHTAGIYLGSWVAGTTSRMRIGYNRGPSSWSHSQVLQYPEGTRCMITIWKGRWKA